MRVLVDTSVWSLALRRSSGHDTNPSANALRGLIADGRAEIIGPIRQELLSGIRRVKQFLSLRSHLRAFPDLKITGEDWERAAEMLNTCRSQGIQGSNTDFVICAVAERYGLEIFTTDRDFSLFATLLPLKLFIDTNQAT